ncbi:hypothetical protein [Streptomyces sp. NPDC046197]|uniref:hypothetical protein n=1 Tax=Streptomyces sp. NPDC046197 TaxID=3154337 RepID=UPI00340CA3A7
MERLLFPGDAQFWYETLRSFGHVAYGGADFGEVVATSRRNTEGDYGSWYEEWPATANRVAGEAQRALEAGHPVSARDGFLRASNYYRSAEHVPAQRGEAGSPRKGHTTQTGIPGH